MFFTLTYCLGLALILITILLLYSTRHFNYWKNKNVEFIKPIPFFGNVFKVVALKTSIGEFLWEIYNQTKKPIIGFFVFDKPFLLIRDPELIKKILIKDFEHFIDRSIIENRKYDEIASNILFILKNPLWRSVRDKFTPVFAVSKLKSMYPLMVNVGKDLHDYIKYTSLKEDISDAREIAMKFTTDVIASCAFGVNAYCFEDDNAKFREAARRFFDWGVGRKISMASYFWGHFLVKLFKLKFFEPNAMQFISEVLTKSIEERVKSKGFRGDLIDILIQLKEDNRPGEYTFEPNMLIAQAVQFFVAGFEPTGATISFALYELSMNMPIQDRLRNEINTTLKNHGSLTYDALRDMTYLELIVKETLRKYPVLSFLDRRCTKPFTIPDTNVVIEKGIPIYISLLGLQMDPKYFPNPKIFDPERFAPKNKTTRTAYSYMPFGEGPHNCIGGMFGCLAVKTALISVLSEFEVVPCKATPKDIQFDSVGFIIAPEDGIKIHFRKKSKDLL